MTFLSLLLIGMVILGGLLFAAGFILWMQRKNKRALIGKRVATIVTASGSREDKLLDVDGNKLVDNTLGKNPAPFYIVRPDKSYDMWWPPGRPKLLQVSVKSYLFAEGNPEPWDPFSRPLAVTTEVLGNLLSIGFSKAMVGRSEEIVVEQGAPRKRKFGKWLLIGLAAGGITIGIIVYLMLMR